MPTELPDLTELEAMTKRELAAVWAGLFDTPAPARSGRELLLHGLGWEVQARRQNRGLGAGARKRLRKLAALYEAGGEPRLATADALRPGTTIVKTHRGRAHTVTVLDAGFEYEGTTYSSLTQVARAISGTHRNGPLFFGLRGGGPRCEVIGHGG
ncbi:MAG: hypothetical protein ACI8TX_003956 [Hyphomicrobiaceae bacterium]|jgi:hypothetical protein